MTSTDQSKFLSVYPEGWFGRTATAKQHAVSAEGVEFDRHGNPAREGRRSSYSVTAVCGATGQISGNEFRYTEGNAITCSRCARKVAAAKAVTA